MNVSAGRVHLWEKIRAGLGYAWQKYGDQADWFLKADDDS